MTPLLVLCVLLLQPVSDDLPVAQAEDVTYDTEDYGRWLVERLGYVHVRDYLVEQLALREAGALGLLPADADVQAAYEEERLAVIERFHKGDPERWALDLENRGQDPAAHAIRRKGTLRFELALGNIARERRVVDEDKLRKRYEEIYGALGEEVVLDTLFYSTFAQVPDDGTKEDIPTGKASAKERAAAARAALEAGASIAELLPASDETTSEFVVDGRITQYRKRLLGQEVERAVQSLDDAGDIGGPVEVWDGFWVVQLVGRRRVSFDEAREALVAIIKREPVASAELSSTSEWLLEARGAEILLR